jgi:hypothetical protein
MGRNRSFSVVIISTMRFPFSRELMIEGFCVIGKATCSQSLGKSLKEAKKCLFRNGYVLKSSWSNILVFSQTPQCRIHQIKTSSLPAVTYKPSAVALSPLITKKPIHKR